MRLALVTDAAPPQVNGVVVTLRTLAARLEQGGHDVRFVTPASFRTFPCPTYPEIRLALFPGFGLRRALDSLEPDAIHIATEGPLGMAARRYCLREGLPFTTSYHTRYPEYLRSRAPVPERLTYAWLRRFHAKAERVMVPTRSIQSDLQARGFHNTVIWPRGVDINRFCPEGPPPPVRHRPRGRGPVFVYVGRVAVEKNLRAFLSLDLPGTKWVIGGGPQLEQLRAEFPDAQFTGPVDHAELPAYYRAADVFVFPSRTDTFGLVLLEAMACGVPVAAYPVAGPLDVVAGSGAGVLHADLREAALRALAVPPRVARTHAEGFSWDSVSRTFFGYLAPISRAPELGRAAATG